MKRVTIDFHKREYDRFLRSLKEDLASKILHELGKHKNYDEYLEWKKQVDQSIDSWVLSRDYFLHNSIKYLVDAEELKIESWGQQIAEVVGRHIIYPLRILHSKIVYHRFMQPFYDQEENVAKYIAGVRKRWFIKRLRKEMRKP